MNEQLLQFIWQHSLFTSNGLHDINNIPISIIRIGTLNRNEGPDFFNARIKIGALEMAGNIEIHVNASDWNRHLHQTHPAYQNIILHIVWNNDTKESLGNFPTLVIKDFIAPAILEQYKMLQIPSRDIPCHLFISQISPLTIQNWKDRLVVERWQQKLQSWESLFGYVQHDWRQLLLIKLSENFGFKVNAVPMYLLAQSISIVIIEKINNNPLQIEALLFGQSGLLPDNTSEKYVQNLKSEYQYLQQRFGLESIKAPWKFLRMRPANFPTIRIAQLAQIMAQSNALFGKLLQAKNYKDVLPLFQFDISTYWQEHYHFNKKSSHQQSKKLGKQSIENIIINTIAPFQFFYGVKMEDERLKEQSLALLESIASEKNQIINLWKSTGIKIQSAACTQSLIQLYNEYCSQKKCLQCQIGAQVLKG